MKSLLKDYYNLDIEELIEINEGYVFFVDDELFFFYFLDKKCNFEFFEEIYNYVRGKGIKLHDIVLNVFNEYISEDYILMKVNVLNDVIDYDDVINFNNCDMNVFKKYYIGIRDYWFNILDNVEKDIIKYIDDVRYDFYYYMGVMERLLSYISGIDENNFNLCLSHKKRYNNAIDYYNPFNLCIDLKYKDIINYLLCNNKLTDLFNYIGYINEDEYKYILFMLLIPYDYFNYINDDNYRSNVDKYEEYVNYVLDVLGIKKRSN